jgi:transposase-like protein
MAERGIILTYEVVQYWRRKLGRVYVKRLCPQRPRHGANWPLDEVFRTTWWEITGSAPVV